MRRIVLVLLMIIWALAGCGENPAGPPQIQFCYDCTPSVLPDTLSQQKGKP